MSDRPLLESLLTYPTGSDEDVKQFSRADVRAAFVGLRNSADTATNDPALADMVYNLTLTYEQYVLGKLDGLRND